MHNPIKPGTDNQTPGRYKEVDEKGNDIENARHCTIEQGERLPPTQKAHNQWMYIS